MSPRSAHPRFRVRAAVAGALAACLVAAPAASAASPRADDPGMPAAPVIGFALLSVCGLVAVGMLVVRLHANAHRPPAARTGGPPVGDPIEDELQAMIAAGDVRARAP